MEHDAQITTAPDGHLTFTQLVDGGIADPDTARGRVVDAGEHIDQGGLSAAGFANYADKFAFVETNINTV